MRRFLGIVIGSMGLLVLPACRHEDPVFARTSGALDQIDYRISRVQRGEGFVRFHVTLRNRDRVPHQVWLRTAKGVDGEVPLFPILIVSAPNCIPEGLNAGQRITREFTASYSGEGILEIGRFFIADGGYTFHDCDEVQRDADAWWSAREAARGE